jgi:glyoxylase-like metal-dependent hydrolase (beta-lactamase superfamily II)
MAHRLESVRRLRYTEFYCRREQFGGFGEAAVVDGGGVPVHQIGDGQPGGHGQGHAVKLAPITVGEVDTVSLAPELTMLRVGNYQFYLWDDGVSRTLIDTGAAGSLPTVAEQVTTLELIVLTHCHTDHCGSAAELRDWSGATIAAGAGDAAIIRGERPAPWPIFADWERPIYEQVSPGLPWVAPAVPVDRELAGGEVLDFGGGAHMIAIPGHTEGSIAIYLPGHRVLFTGDTIANVGQLTLGVFNQDRVQTVAAFRRLAELDVEIACFGHGEPVLSGAGERLRAVAATL